MGGAESNFNLGTILVNESWITKVKTLVKPICEREGCTLYDVESTGARSSRVLKVYIDSKDGVTIQQCADVSNGLSLLLDVEDIVPGGKYSLEVSSPGLERNLSEEWHYEGAIGKLVKVKTHKAYMPTEGPETKKGVKLIKGVLKVVNKESITLEDEKSRVYEVVVADITKAHTVFDFSKASKGKKKKF